MKKKKSVSRSNAPTKATPAAGAHKTQAYWLDHPANVEWIVRAVYLICAALVVADIFVPKHGPFAVEHVFGFYAWYGFFACVGLVLAAKALRRVLMRPENYYDR
jgi:hypothetical protein